MYLKVDCICNTVTHFFSFKYNDFNKFVLLTKTSSAVKQASQQQKVLFYAF